MNLPLCKTAALLLVGVLFVTSKAEAQSQYLPLIGMTLLRATTTNLNGTGIRVAQPEDRPDSPDEQDWEVNPANVGQPVSRFTYASADGVTNTFPNALGTNTTIYPSHADYVGQKFYGIPDGMATNIAHVDNFEADYFYNHHVVGLVTLNDPVVSQSYTFGSLSVPDQQQIDSQFDEYAVRFNTLFVSAVDNNGNVHAPATSYNCIGVAAYGDTSISSIGPTADNGRCKPDICAPDTATSFSTPQVAGAATVLMQAALRGDGGGDTNSSADMRTLKALLLNGAVKLGGWTNSSLTPLDARYGAGAVNIFNAYRQLIGGKQGYSVSNTVSLNAAHPPTGATATVSVLNGWDFNTNNSSSSLDAVRHYYFNATNNPGGCMCTATLVWNRQSGQTNINNLDLFLYNCADSNLVACSTSRVDNVEHIFLPRLAAGRYDLQVWKAGGSNIVSNAEPYALAFAFTSPSLTITQSGANTVLTWPLYPTGFLVETSTNLTLGPWSDDDLPDSSIVNGVNQLQFNSPNAVQFFRLRSPTF